MDLQIEYIGTVSVDVGADDAYMLVRVPNREVVPAEKVRQHLDKHYYVHTDTPGGYFCRGVTVLPKPHNDCEFVVIVHHRRNV